MRCRDGRNERVCQLLLDGKPHTKREIEEHFKGTDMEDVIYRISTYIWFIKRSGGNVRSIRNGREVDGYQLLNPKEFDISGRYVGKSYIYNEVKESGNILHG